MTRKDPRAIFRKMILEITILSILPTNLYSFCMKHNCMSGVQDRTYKKEVNPVKCKYCGFDFKKPKYCEYAMAEIKNLDRCSCFVDKEGNEC